MKKTLILICLSFMMVACSSSQPIVNSDGTVTTSSAIENTHLIDQIKLLKTNGCEAITPRAKVALLLVIKSQVPDYPSGGLCNTDLIDEVYERVLIYLEADPNAISYRPVDLRRKADSRHRSLDYRDRGSILLG